jgi:hypothetical protein
MNSVFMGQSFFHGRYNQFLDYMRPMRWFMMFDWKSFDSRVSPSVMRTALTIFRNFFVEEAWDRFDAVANGFINKTVEFEGAWYSFSGGIPSGHAWTSLVGTLCNYVMTLSLFIALYGRSLATQCRFALCGDDVFVGLPACITRLPSYREIAAMAFLLHGGVIKEESYCLSPSLDGPLSDGMSFLAHGFRDGKPVRFAPEIVDSLMYPQSYPRTKWDRLSCAIAFVQDTPWSVDNLDWQLSWLRVCYQECGFSPNSYREFEKHVLIEAFELSEDPESSVALAIVPENIRIFGLRRVCPKGHDVDPPIRESFYWWTSSFV